VQLRQRKEPQRKRAAAHRSRSAMAPKKKKARQQRPLENEILDPEIVLKEVRRCKALLEKQKPIDESTVDLSAYRVVKEMTGDKVAKEIHDLFLKCAESILAGNSFKFDVPSRAAGNQHYVPELDRIVLKQNTSERSFANVSQVRKTAIMTRVLSLVHEVTTKGIHVTKRDLFYTDVKLFKKQEESDAVLDDAACMIGCPRSCLNVVAADKGLVVGRLQFREDGDLIDCTRMGVTGKAIPV
jgi:meiotic recombination protein SPO11